MSNFRRALDIVANEQRNRGTRQAVPTAGSEFRRILKQKAAEQSSRIDELRAEADRVNASTKHLEDAYMRAAEKRPQSTQPQWVNNLSDSDAARLKNELSRYRPQRKAGETDAQMMERLGRAAEREWKTTDAALAAMGTSRAELRQQQKAPWVDNLSEQDAARLQSELAAAANPNAAAHDVANLTRKYDEVSAKLSNISTSLPDAERTRQAQALGDKASAYEQQIKDRQNGAALVQRYLREFERNTYERDIMNAPDFAEMSAKGAADSDLDSKRHMINTVHLAQYGDGSDPVYGEMTEDEKGIFNYLWAARGKDEAEKYLKRLDETLSERAGRRLAESVLNEENGFLRGVGSVTLGITSGFENAASGIKQTFTKEAITPTAGQYAAGYVRSELDGGAAFLFDLSQSAANMTPSILLSSVTAGIGGAVGMSAGAAGTLGQVMGAVEMGLQSRGNAISEKLREGYTYEQASLYGTLVGASEGGLQYLLGGISKLGGRLTGGKVAAKIAAIDNAFGRIALKLGTSMASEGLEEGLQEILEPIFAALILNEEYEPAKWNEVAYAALLGAVSAGLFEGVSTFGEDSARRSTGKEIAALGSDTVQAVIDAGLKSDRNSMAYKVAQELQSRQAAGKTITPHALGEVYAEVIGTSGAELDTVFEAAKKRQAETAANDAADSEEVVSEKEITTPEDTAAVAERGQGGFESSEYDEGTSAKLRKSLDILGQATGRTYRFIDEIDVGAGATANGLYDGNTVWLSRASRNPLTTAASHETGHILADSAPDAWADFVSYVVGKKGEGAVRQAYELYSSRGLINTVAAAQEEVASDYLGEMLSNEDTLRSFTRDIERGAVKRNTAQKILDAIRRFIARLRGTTTSQRVARDMGITITEATRAVDMITHAMNATSAAQHSDMEAAPEQAARRVAASYSIEYDANGTPYAVIDEDILAGVPRSEWVRTVKNNMREKFPNGVVVGNNVIKINAKTTGEITESEYSKWIRDFIPERYRDKMLATNNADEIVRASRNYVGEGLKHPRKDNIIEFARGDVQLRIGSNDYTADVVVATTKSRAMVLYDMVNIMPTKIQTEKQTQAAATSRERISDRTLESASADSISESGEDVNTKFSLSEDQTHSEQFKRWFGDWQNDPEHASKVVDENGEPLVVYHATWSEPFTVFDRSLLGNITDGNATDPVFAATAHIGFWFNTQNLMGSAGKRSEAVYINIRNPYIAMSVENLSREIEEYAGVYNDGEYDAAASGEAFADLLATRGYDGIEVEDEEFGGTSFVVLHPEQIKSATDNIGTFDRKNPDIRFSLSAGETPYNGTVVLDEDTVDKYLMDYASKSSPKYAQAYIAYMSPEQFLKLTTSIVGRNVIEAQSRELNAEEFGDATRQVPIQLSIDHETGEVNGHEGRHRAAALISEGIRRVPVLLFDSSNKLSKTPIEMLDLHGQDFGTSRSYATVTVENLLPLSYENRDAVVETYSKAPSLERAMERHGMKQSLRYSLEENENAEASTDPNLADPTPSAEAIEKAEIEAELAEEDARRADRLVLPSVEDEVINRLPKKAKDYLRRVERKFVRNFSEALGVPRKTQSNFLDGVVRSISATYLDNGTISDRALSRLFDRAYDAGIVVDREYYDQYKHIRDHIRKQPVCLPEVYQTNIADFNEFCKRAFGEIAVAKKGGLDVDVMYAELHTMASELFPETITHPADQLQRIAEVAKSIRISKRTLDEYYGADAATFRKWARNDFGAAVGEFTNELLVVSRYEKEANAPDDVAMPAPRTVAEASEVYAALKEARRNLARVERNSLLTSEDEQTVGRLLRGELQLRHVEKRTNYAAIREMYEAKAEYEKYSKQIREYREQLKKAKRAEAEELLETSDAWKDKKAGLLYSRETMERNIRDIVPDAELAEKIIDKYFTPIHTAEAGATRMKNRMRDKVRALNLSRKAKKGDVVSESHAVQLYGEASDNIQMLRDNPRMEMRDGKTLEEWNTVLRELWEQNPGIDRAKIENAAEVFHSIYDELFGLMNEARVRNGYEPVNYRKGYFPHFEEGGSDGLLVSFAKSLGIDSNVTALPTTINGLTHTFKPGITWFGHALERVGWNTVYDAVEGFDRYIEGAAAVIYQTDNIQNLRALASQIRYRAGDEQIKKDADEIRNNTALDDDTQEEKINELYEGRRYALSTFVVELEEYTNLLAGKKSSHDRNMESDFGRWAYNLVKKAASRVGGNMVVANLSSAATNFIPLTQGWSMVSSRDMLRGMWDTLKAIKSPDGFASQSTFLTNRRGSDPLVRTVAQDLSAKGSMPMTWIDEFTSDSLVRARYAQNKRKGLSDAAAMSEADAWAAGVMADRSKGSTPTLFQRQNPLAKLFTQFQLEVNNQLSFVAKDMKHEARTQNYGKRQVVAMILKFIAGAWLYDELYEYIFGRRPALDPIGILNDTVGDMTGYALPNVVSMGVGLAQGKAPNFTTEKKSVDAVLGNLAENLGGELPFVGGVLFEGGRLPISSAIPDVGNLIKAATNSEWSASKRWSTAGKELFKPVSYLLLPFGGGQLKKVIDGMTAVVQGGSYSLDSDGRKKLQYPVFSDGIWGTMSATTKALLFGKSSFSGAQEWVDSGFKTMNADATATYLGLRSAGMKDRDAYETVKGLLSVEDKAERRLMLSEGSSPAEMKFVVYRGMLTASDKEAELLDELLGMGADSGAVVDTMLALHAPADVIKLEGEDVEKDQGVPSELKQFAAALRGEQVDFAEEEEVEKSESAAKLRRDALLASKLSPRERAVVYYAMGASESDKGLMEELVKLDADMGAAAELIIRMKDEPKNAGKYDLVRESGLKEREKDAVCARIMGDSGYDKLTEARGAGISVDIYLEYLSATAGLEGDLDENGKTISGSKKEKVMAEINALSLTAAQKNVLYLHAGYSEKTIDEAPWNRGGLSLPRVK